MFKKWRKHDPMYSIAFLLSTISFLFSFLNFRSALSFITKFVFPFHLLLILRFPFSAGSAFRFPLSAFRFPLSAFRFPLSVSFRFPLLHFFPLSFLSAFRFFPLSVSFRFFPLLASFRLWLFPARHLLRFPFCSEYSLFIITNFRRGMAMYYRGRIWI